MCLVRRVCIQSSLTPTRGRLENTKVAVHHARMARKRRWICFFIFVVIVVRSGLCRGRMRGL